MDTKLEAQMHAQEARTANATIAEIYQLCSGATGEPGNWHGAEPVRAKLAALTAECDTLKAQRDEARAAALNAIDTKLDLQKELDAIRSRWLPISTAPKDEHILILWPPINRATIAILRTKGRKRGWQVFLGYFGGANCAYTNVAPCVWQPLPPPPTTPPPCGSEGKP